jgi:hypothetical protein
VTKRHYIRIALSEADVSAFIKAKAEAEKVSGVRMKDSAFALGVIRKAIDAK